MLAALATLLLAFPAVQSAAAPAPQTRPERTNWEETSTNADVAAFLDELKKLPHGDRLHYDAVPLTVQGRMLRVVHVRLDGTPKLRALIIANIHGGEVEGKETVQLLLREIAEGQHEDLLRHVDLALLPVFNTDGNDEIDAANRFEQNGPNGGVGRRHNSQDRDLNRDFIKAETPEVRVLLRVFATFDPHLFMDLHTTNGSYHGYHLTYCTSLNANTDPELAALMHERFIPSVRKNMLDAHGYRIFDYGNFGRGGPESGWTTFSSEPRLAINYAGLRHCLSLLSEAYSYLPFQDRAKVTRAFVLESLRELVARRVEILKLRAQAEGRAASLPFCYGHELAKPVQGELLVGSVEEKTIEGLGRRRMVKPEFHAVQAPIQTRFVAKHQHALPAAWAIVGDFPLVAQIMCAHGIGAFTLDEPMSVPVEAFAVNELSRPGRPFQGHRLVKLAGAFAKTEAELQKGTLIVPAGHALARLAAQLLEGTSDDGLAVWGYFDAALARAEDAGEGKLSYPVLRLAAVPPRAKMRPVQVRESLFPRLVPYEPFLVWGYEVEGLRASERPATVDLELEVAEAGKRTQARGFDADPRFEGRKLRWKLDKTEYDTLPAVAAGLAALKTKGIDFTRSPVVVRRGPGITHREVVQACEAVREAGVARVLLWLDS